MSSVTHNENHYVHHTIVHANTNVLEPCGSDFMTSAMYMLITKYLLYITLKLHEQMYNLTFITLMQQTLQITDINLTKPSVVYRGRVQTLRPPKKF